jgi:hypothetical protein
LTSTNRNSLVAGGSSSYLRKILSWEEKMKQAGLRVVFMLLIFGIAVTSAFSAESPVDKGSIMVGGGGAFSSLSGKLYEDGDDGATLFLLYPSFGFFPARGLAVGGQLLLGSFSQGDYGISVSGIGPKLTYYFGANKGDRHGKGRTYPYLTSSVLFGQVSADDDDEVSGTLVTIGGGINYMVANSVGVSAEVNYRSDTLKNKEDYSQSGHSINVMVGFSLFLWE